MFQLAMNGLAYQFLWPSSPWWAIHANPFFIGWSALLGAGFSVKFLETPVYAPVMDKLLKILMILSVILIFASLTIDYSLTILAGQLLPLSMILIAIPTAILCLKRGNRAARFYLIAWSAFFIGVILSTLRIMGLIQHNVLTEHGLQIGSAFEMVLLALALADRINIMKMEKDEARQKVIDQQREMVENLNRSNFQIEQAHKLLSISEEKYKLLVEGTKDIIFSLDDNWNFISANRAISNELKINPDTISGKSFLDILYSDQKEQYVTRLLMLEKLEEFKRQRKPVQFRTQFKSPISSEPKEMLLSLEYINIEGKNEILGKASHILEDSLLKYFIEENQKYAIGNYLITAEEITHRITRNLKKYLDSSDMKMIRISLREIIINAIEHGNLEITFEDKSNAIMEDSYFETVRSRQMRPDYRGRKVYIDYSVNSDRVIYTVTDEGPGFDHEDFFIKKTDSPEDMFLAHGRGLAMTKNTFDQVNFNKKGNRVELIKYFKGADDDLKV
jgi:anti-sigma regulatory factor (Ser/Thr protein kinase)/PAS domain-containing protein